MSVISWESDKLNRKEEAEYLIKYLTKVSQEDRDSSFVLNINSEWGFGKTYFLKNLKLELESKNHKVIYFDAWKNDYSKEPLLAFISEINDSLELFFEKNDKSKPYIKSVIKNSLPILVSAFSKKLTGYTIDEIKEEVDSDEDNSSENGDLSSTVSKIMNKATELALENHKTTKNSIVDFKNSMRALIEYMSKEEIEIPIYVLIDELDRCRPNYAIELLESIKHLFDVKGLVFIVATDSKQLAHSINAVYGSKFKSEQYLKRFFDREYTLDEPELYDYIYFLLEKYNILEDRKFYVALDKFAYKNINKNVKIIELFAKSFKLSLRDIEQSIVVLNAISYTWESDNKMHLGYLVYLIMLKQKSSEYFENFILTKNRSFEDSSEFDKSINIVFDNDKEESLSSFISSYISFGKVTYEEFRKNQNRSETFHIIHEGIEGSRYPSIKRGLILKEIQNYHLYVLRGFRIN